MRSKESTHELPIALRARSILPSISELQELIIPIRGLPKHKNSRTVDELHSK